MPKTIRTLFTLLCFAVVAPLNAADLEEVLRKHVDARGGRENWNKIRSLRMTGEYTAFSRVAPYTLTRARDNRYLLDTEMNGRTVIVGYDGETAWWNNHWFKEGAQRITGADAQVALGDAHFVNPLFDHESLGMTAEYLGETEYEGVPALGIRLTHAGGGEETWYLDPDTYLEYARLSPGSDFGRPLTQRTIFDDFREVGGVKIPFFTETQWYTRNRVMQVATVEINVDPDPALFSMPAPQGMAELLKAVGNWHVTVEQRNQPGGPLRESEREVEIRSLMDGRVIEVHYEHDEGQETRWSLSYDPFRKTHRLALFSSTGGYLDIQQGTFDDDGKLTLSNLDTGTPYEVADLTVFSRFNVLEITADRFKIEREVSVDGGENWWVAASEVYTRKP